MYIQTALILLSYNVSFYSMETEAHDDLMNWKSSDCGPHLRLNIFMFQQQE